jgi:hypothetical protein
MLVAFLFRALVPAGYMPVAHAAPGAGHLAFCMGAEEGGVAFSHLVDDLTHPADGHRHAAQGCPFFVAASHAALPAHTGVAVAGLATRYLPLALLRVRAVVVGTVAGPPLGSHAPPLNFV